MWLVRAKSVALAGRLCNCGCADLIFYAFTQQYFTHAHTVQDERLQLISKGVFVRVHRSTEHPRVIYSHPPPFAIVLYQPHRDQLAAPCIMKLVNAVSLCKQKQSLR